MATPKAVILIVGTFMFGKSYCALVKGHFSYSQTDVFGPHNWHTIWPTCKGLKQSPIDINIARVVQNPLLRFNYQPILKPLGGILTNTGHVPKFTFTSVVKPVLTGVPHLETDQFVFENLHVHFHKNSISGSEHTLNGRFFAGEIHLVHYNRKYGTFNNAMNKKDGLAVIAVFIQDLGRPSPLHVEDLVVETEETAEQGATLSLYINPISFLPRDRRFFTYSGSLTTPGCQESVTWIVMATPISVPDSDMEHLRQMKNRFGQPISFYGNVRPRAKLGRRVVESNF